MKKFTALLLAAITLITLAACASSDDAENELSAALDGIVAANEEVLSTKFDRSLFDAVDCNGFEYLRTCGFVVDEMLPDIFAKLFSGASYKVNSVAVKGNTATADVDITALNLASAIDDINGAFTECGLAAIDAGDAISLDELVYIIGIKLDEVLAKVDTITTNVTVNMERSHGSWTVTLSDELIDAFTGGLPEPDADFDAAYNVAEN